MRWNCIVLHGIAWFAWYSPKTRDSNGHPLVPQDQKSLTYLNVCNKFFSFENLHFSIKQHPLCALVHCPKASTNSDVSISPSQGWEHYATNFVFLYFCIFVFLYLFSFYNKTAPRRRSGCSSMPPTSGQTRNLSPPLFPNSYLHIVCQPVNPHLTLFWIDV